MRMLPLLTVVLGLLLVVTPVSAHHKTGHDGGPPHGESGHGATPRRQGPTTHERGAGSDERHRAGQREASDPQAGPGNSGAAHWCKAHYADDRGAPFPFRNRGQCVSFFAHGGEIDDADGNADDLEITDVSIDDEGTFRLAGVGAESRVTVTIGGITGRVFGFGRAEPASDGSWVVEGTWACGDNDEPEEARIRARDADERDSLARTFPCDEQDD